MTSKRARAPSRLPALIGLSVLLGAGMSVASKPREPAQISGTKRLPNEAGSIPVLMYHRIGKPEGTWTRTPKNFRRDLEELYRRGYRPISLTDMVRGRIDLPAGVSPVVLTFDDGHAGQLRFIDNDGQTIIDPDCAVGILLAFHQKHPDFPIEATFFLNGQSPFGQPEHVREKLELIVSRGMDIGNHTTVHANLTDPRFHDPQTIQRVIGKQAAYLQSVLDRMGPYEVNTYALCNGQRPPGKALRALLLRGSFKGHEYSNIAVLNVGAGPVASPIDKDFRPHFIPRIRASQTRVEGLGMYDWLERLDAQPLERFVSDGDPSTFTVPKALRHRASKEKLHPRHLVLR